MSEIIIPVMDGDEKSKVACRCCDDCSHALGPTGFGPCERCGKPLDIRNERGEAIEVRLR